MSIDESQTFLREMDRKLWTAADKLRSSLDAAVYKHALLGLIFLKTLRERFNHFEGEGTVFGSINRKDFEKLSFVAPSDDLVRQFDRNASPIDNTVENNEKQSRTLAALRDALLPKLLSGELRASAINAGTLRGD